MRGASLVVVVFVSVFLIGAAAAAWRSSSLRLLAGPSRRNRCNQHRRNGVPPLRALVPAKGEGAVRWRVEDTVLEGRGVTALLRSLGSAPMINCLSTVDVMSTPETATREEATFANLLVGTKRGQIVRLRANQSSGRFLHAAEELFIQDSDGSASSASTSKLPIYCFVSPRSSSLVRGESLLLAGGADRYVSVYRLSPDITTQDRGEEARANLLQPSVASLEKPPARDGVLWRILKLGPHTGWVKDVVLLIDDDAGDEAATASHNSNVPSSCTVYSIGCNGIEIWKSYTRGNEPADAQEEAREDARWRNAGKWSVESSARVHLVVGLALFGGARQRHGRREGVGGRRRRAHPRLVDRWQPRQHPPCSNER
jgi:hypothetical protein